jgi:hypothetical protein
MCKTQITTVGQTSEGLDLRRQQLTKLRLMKMTKKSVPMVPQYMQQNKA